MAFASYFENIAERLDRDIDGFRTRLAETAAPRDFAIHESRLQERLEKISDHASALKKIVPRGVV